MNNSFFRVAIILGAIVLAQSCAKVPITGRRQMNLVERPNS
jgi:hypothetical protein